MARKTTTARGGGTSTRAASARGAADCTNAASAEQEVLAATGEEAEEGEDAANSDDDTTTKPSGYVPPPTNWRKLFLAKLCETSNVSAAARHARVQLPIVYKHRRTDAAFRAAWFAALAEGYDNLEMELLEHLRAVETGEEAEVGAAAKKRSFDAATAFRCLAAHRDNVAREKGRRTLDQEVATIAAINEKIDRLRLNARAADKAITAARRTNRVRVSKPADSGESA